MKIMKRIGAFVLAAALIITGLPLSYVSASNTDTFTVTGMNENTKIRADHVWMIYLNHSGSFTDIIGESFDWPATVGGQDKVVTVLNDGGMVTVAIWPDLIPSDGTANTTLVLKAGAKVGNQGTTANLAADVTLCFNQYGLALNQPIQPDTTGVKLTQLDIGQDDRIYATASVDDAFPDIMDDNWDVRPTAASGVIDGKYYYENTNGVTIGDTYYQPNGGEIEFVKIREGGNAALNYYINPNVATTNPATDTMLTFQGLYMWDGKLVEFAPNYFKWSGSTWEQVIPETNYTVTFTSFDKDFSIYNTGVKGIYFTGTPDNKLPVDSNWEIKYQAANADSGIYINNVKQENANIRKVPVGTSTYYWVGDYNDVQVGDVLTIKGRFVHADSNSGITLSSEVQVTWLGNGWTYGAVQPPVQLTFDGINGATAYNDGYQGWFFYLTPSVELPGTGDSTEFRGIQMSINGGEAFDIVLTKSNHAGTAFLPLESSILPKEITSNTTITIKAGTATANDGSKGIQLTQDFTIYANANGISTTGFIQDSKYQQLTFTNIIEPTGFKDDANAWVFYLEPSAALPGTGDETSFAGLKMSIDGGEEIELQAAHSLHCMPGQLETLFVRVEASQLPKNITKNTKLVIKQGTAKANDGSDGIKVLQDFTIYLNQYGVSSTGFVKEPTYTQVKFTGLNDATGYVENVNGWNIYMKPSATLAGTDDMTTYQGIQVSLNDGTPFAVNITKSSHQGMAFLHLQSDILPKKITENTKIVVKSGKASASDGNAIWLTEDFTIYANQYGWSTTGFIKKIVPSETSVLVKLDRNTAYGGSENGVYLTTADHFPVDTTWTTRIKAVGYDDNSGVFLNGEKIDAPLIRFSEDKMYVGIVDAGYTAKDHDVLTIKGTFALGSYGVSYKEYTLYFNGKVWNTEYVKAAPETYTKIKIESIHSVTSYNEQNHRWNLHLTVDTELPGVIDMTNFNGLKLQIGSKVIDAPVAHSYEHTLFVPIEASELPANCPDGTKITLLAGKALAGDKSTGIELVENFTCYTYKGFVTAQKPTTNTDWQDINISRLLRTGYYNEAAMCWQLYLHVEEELKTEGKTVYLQIPVNVNGKVYKLNATQEGKRMFFLTIPDYILSGTAKSATISIPKGCEVTANAGYNGFRLEEELVVYLFNGAISDTQFTEVEKIETAITGLQNVTPVEGMAHVYFRVSKDIPGTAWYEYYNDFVYYYNGKAIHSYANKSDSSQNKILYFPIETSKVGDPKEGDIIVIKDGTVITCGGYEITITKGYEMVYRDGVWSQLVKSDAQKPADIGSLWSIARFDKAYIPTTTDGSVLYSAEDQYNAVTSMKDLKDFTVSFGAKKDYKDEIATGFRVILRGNPISENEEMTNTLLYGYVISFSAMQMADPKNPEETIWSGYIELWKNGQNDALIDQYRVCYVHEQTEHPFFEYGVEYNYEFSIYNVTETCACIEVKVNGETVMRYYDEASSDPLDPAVNAGTFGIYGTGPNYIRDDIVELKEVISEKDTCKTGEKVRVAATYPSVIEGAEFTVDSKNASVKEGVFVAEKEGTYTVSCSYKGKELKSKVITVTKGADSAETTGFIHMILPIVAVTLVAIVGTAVVIVVLRRKKKRDMKG